MDISFNCSKCGQHIVIDEAGAGQLVDCPKCGKPLEVPFKSEPVAKPVMPVPVKSPQSQPRRSSPLLVTAVILLCLLCAGLAILVVILMRSRSAVSGTVVSQAAAEPVATPTSVPVTQQVQPPAKSVRQSGTPPTTAEVRKIRDAFQLAVKAALDEIHRVQAGFDIGVTHEEYRRSLIELKTKIDDVGRAWSGVAHAPDPTDEFVQYQNDTAKLDLTLDDIVQKYSLALAGWDGALAARKQVIDLEAEMGLPHDRKNMDNLSMPEDVKHYLVEASKLTDDVEKMYSTVK